MINEKKLFECLREHNDLFQGKLGKVPNVEVKADLKPNAVPYHCKQPFRVPHIYLETLKKEVDRLCATGVLEKTDGTSPWCANSFIIPKKDGKV